MNPCLSVRSRFSEYLDGAVSGAEMRRIAAHLEGCRECAAEFGEWRQIQRLLTSLGPVKAPADLSLRLRVAISQERSRTTQRRLDVWQMHWQNSVAPVLARGAAGLASAVILLGALAVMVGAAAAPQTVAAYGATPNDSRSPQFLYTAGAADVGVTFRQPVLVEVAISDTGRVYDYRIISGPHSPAVREQLDNYLLMSHFSPALDNGVPVSGRALLSFSQETGRHG
jgi:anti-sigma factor RsiW